MSVETNAYYRLVEDLKSGKLKLRDLDIAVMEWINSRTDIPEEIKNLLVQHEGGGLVRNLFKLIGQTIGSMELAVRRAKQSL